MDRAQLHLPILIEGPGESPDEPLLVMDPIGERRSCGVLQFRLGSRGGTATLEASCNRCGQPQVTEWLAWEPPPPARGEYAEGYGWPQDVGFYLLDTLESCTKLFPPREEALAWIGLLEQRMAAHGKQVLATCDPRSVAVARRFAPEEAGSVYHALLADHTGHVRQLAEGQPALLMLIAHLWPVPDGARPGALRGEPIWSGVCDGVALRELRCRVARKMELSDAETRRLPWLLRTYPTGAGLDGLLALAHMPDIPTSDAPTDIEARQRWVAALRTIYDGIPRRERSDDWARAAMGWVSYHASELLRDDGESEFEFELDRLVAYLRRTGRVLGRRTLLGNLLGAQERFWEGTVQQNHRRYIEREIERSGNPPLPAVPFEQLTDAARALSITPIETPRGLLDETTRMQHCIVTYMPQLQSGGCAAYHVQLGKRHSTALLRELNGRWVCHEQSGLRNREVDADERAAVEAWIAQMQDATDDEP